MSVFHVLRHHRSLTRWVLACWLLALGSAAAGPWLQQKTLTLVCSAIGQPQWQWTSNTPAPRSDPSPAAITLAAAPHTAPTPLSESPLLHHSLDCALCLSLSAPPPGPSAQSALTRAAPHTPPPRNLPRPITRPYNTPLQARAPPAAMGLQSHA